MAFKINIDSQHFVYRNQMFRFNNSQTSALKIQIGQLIIIGNKDQSTQGLQVNKVETLTHPPIFDCTPAVVDPMSFTALSYSAKYICEIDTGRDDDLVSV